MGIRFQCPNGHPLHVKDFLAGKRGICPECDAKFVVPKTSGGRVNLVGDGSVEDDSAGQFDTPSVAKMPSPAAQPESSFPAKPANLAAPSSLQSHASLAQPPESVSSRLADNLAPIQIAGSHGPPLTHAGRMASQRRKKRRIVRLAFGLTVALVVLLGVLVAIVFY
jgi:hypothetical protein